MDIRGPRGAPALLQLGSSPWLESDPETQQQMTMDSAHGTAPTLGPDCLVSISRLSPPPGSLTGQGWPRCVDTYLALSPLCHMLTLRSSGALGEPLCYLSGPTLP